MSHVVEREGNVGRAVCRLLREHAHELRITEDLKTHLVARREEAVPRHGVQAGEDLGPLSGQQCSTVPLYKECDVLWSVHDSPKKVRCAPVLYHIIMSVSTSCTPSRFSLHSQYYSHNQSIMSLKPELEAIIQEKSLLQHPFYQAWSAGTLPLEALREYAKQYYHLEKFVPRLLSRIHTNCESPLERQEITENMYDEEHGGENHRELWLRFAEGLGLKREEVENSEPIAQTAKTLSDLDAICAKSTLSGAAALAAYESQNPDVSVSKIEGLEEHYNITDDRAQAFFKVHSTLDVEHADSWWKMIDTHASTEEAKQEARDAVAGGRDALWNFLSGICHAYLPDMQCDMA